MNRRNYLKSLVVSTAAGGLLLNGCTKETPKVQEKSKPAIDRTPEEAALEERLMGERFLTDHEMKTVTVLADIIIPKDEKSGSASDARVPDFIEFMMKDKPDHQVPMRGGLRWLDVQCMKRFKSNFVSCGEEDQIALIDDIAFPEQAKPGMEPGVAFFNLMRDLTATGFFTSEIGLKDLDYQGNRPNQWNGVPEEVLKHYGIAYDARTLEISAKYS